MSREIGHLIACFFISILFGVLLGIDAQYFPLFVIVGLVGSTVPDLDTRLGLGHRNPLMHSFLIPILLSLVFPSNLLLTAFFVGYTSHMLIDLRNSKRGWVWMEKRVGAWLLVLSVIIMVMLIFNVNLTEIIGAFV